jgi:aspartate/methionine/tyrosine aminotransferase
MDVLRAANARAAKGDAVYHLEAGEPGGGPPEKVLEAARRALGDGRLGYTESLGIPVLRARIARFYGERYGLDLSPGRVIVTAGASAGFLLAFLACFDAGARIALAEPGYPAYRNILTSLGLHVVALPATQESRYQPTPHHLEAAGALDGLLVQSPANPTGAMLPAPALAALIDAAHARDLWFIADEIYHGITYGAPAPTALAYSNEAIVINSFSKYFAMTGFRIGWMIVPDALLRVVERLAQNYFICANALSQIAALAAFDDIPALEARVAGYGRNRAVLLDALGRAGIPALAPDGAFYIYADVGGLTKDAARFAADLLATTGVAVTPGIDFGGASANTAIRLSFAGSEAEITEAATLLARFSARRG